MKPIRRYFQAPEGSYFLFGPRGTGKSTWVKEQYKKATLIDLLEPDSYRRYYSFPEHFSELVLAHKDCKTFIIDEIQKAPELLSVVHQLIEMKKGWQFILTGSSARKLKRSGVDLLAGRAQLKFLHPFMASELGIKFNLSQNLKSGMLPLALESSDPINTLKNYIALYMREEVHAEGLVRRVDEFGRFLETMSFSQASILNYSNIARDSAVSSKTIESYITILEDLLLSIRIPIFTKKAKRDLTTHPKFYYFDAGVYQILRPKGPLDNTDSILGQSLETLIMQHLRAWLSYSRQDGELYFWRTRTGLEVDFIIYGEIGFYALEVKKSNRIKPEDLRGLEAFQKDYPQAQCILLYLGKEKRVKNNILCIPVETFLVQLNPNEFIVIFS